MFFTHYFAHEETLLRARAWLCELGFQPHQMVAHTDGELWLTVRVDPTWIAALRVLFNAAERGDPDGSPSFWNAPHCSESTLTRKPRTRDFLVIEPSPTTLIGWHPQDVWVLDSSEVEALGDLMNR
jgi:hypothetical protein